MAKEVGVIIEIKDNKRSTHLFYYPDGKKFISRVQVLKKGLLEGFKIHDKVELEFFNDYNEVERNDKILGFDNNKLETIVKA